MLQKISVIYTGGTIGMIKNPDTGALEPFPFDNMYEYLPMLKEIEAIVHFTEMLPLIDSSDTDPQFWINLARLIRDQYDQFDGFVILHGTDTMSYTASALSFLLENLSKPVILTGSQLPLGVLRTDGRENILNSIEIAATHRNGTPLIKEVCIFFENSLFRGNRTFKSNAENFDAFLSANYPKLAEVGLHVKFNESALLPPNNKNLKAHQKIDPNVAILKIFPGMSTQIISSIINTPNLKALIIETYGSGNAPSDAEFMALLDEAIQKGIIILNVTQCKCGGSVEMSKYSAGLQLQQIGVLGGKDLTTEAAVTKLMFLLGLDLEREELERLITTPLCGEMAHS